MKVGIDIDDVLLDFIGPFIKYHNLVTSEEMSFDSITNYDLTKHLSACPNEDALHTFMQGYFLTKTYDKLPPINGAVGGIRQLQKAGHDIYFITSRQGKAVQKTYNWLHRHGFPIRQVYFNRDKGWMAEKLGLDMHIDDCLDNLDRVVEVNPNVIPIVFTRPWNQSNTEYLRANNWIEVVGIIEKEAARRNGGTTNE